MRWGRYEPLESSTRALDPLRNRIAELRNDERSEGLISTCVERRWAERTGILWWKTWTGPHEVLVFEISWFDKRGGHLYDDGVVEPEDVLVRELLTGTVKLYGHMYEVRWLSGDELAEAEIVMGVADLWAQASKPPPAR